MKIYGLTQKQVNEARKRFNDGEITFEEAMWRLGYQYSDSLTSYYLKEWIARGK